MTFPGGASKKKKEARDAANRALETSDQSRSLPSLFPRGLVARVWRFGILDIIGSFRPELVPSLRSVLRSKLIIVLYEVLG